MIDYSLRQLRAFLLVAQYRSFSRAAGALFMTPSGLSVLIRELENQLGVRLFERTTRHVALTSSGADLLTSVQRNLQELDGAMARMAQGRPDTDVSFSVGATPLIAATVATQAIKEFRAHRPDFRLQLFDGDAATIMQHVESGALDMGLGVFFKHLPAIRRTPLFRFHLMVIRAHGDHAARRPTTPWSALKGERLVSLLPSVPLQQLVDKHLARAGVAPQRGLLHGLPVLIAMVEAGEGAGIIPSFGLPACRERGVIMSRLTNPVVHVDFQQIRRAGKRLHPVVEEFTSFLQRYIASWAGRSAAH